MQGFMLSNSDVQGILANLGYYKGAVDGIFGPASWAAVNAFAQTHLPQADADGWSQDRKRFALEQTIIAWRGIDVGKIDGLVGPQTLAGLEIYQNKLRDDNPLPTLIRQHKPIWPRQKDVVAFFGNPADESNLVNLQTPYDMCLAWDTSQRITRFKCHKKVHDSALAALTKIAGSYDAESRKELGLDLFGGCYNPRKMRGGTKWSMHAWGIAIDFNPAMNQLRWGYERASLARPECATFWNIWEEFGWVSLGRERNFDWMHVQAARL